ncbi:MAG: hypothetical protein JJU40_01735 [Rhodobacteraceae bacterium]|nr:hypothetical protein [Paracoccaceae bacterium]
MARVPGFVVLAAGLAAAPALASAQGVALSFGAALTSSYVADGVTLSNNNPALQAYAEGAVNGFYAGIWASTVRDGTDDYEVDLYAGYRNEINDVLSYDVGVVRYLLNNSGGANEVLFTLGIAAAPRLGLEVFAGYDPGARNTRTRLTASWNFNDNLSLSASVGANQANANTFWNVGASYALTGNFSVDLRHHDTSTTGPLTVLTLSMDF